MKKALSIVIALLMILTVFVSCTETPDETDVKETNGSETSDVIESVSDETTYETDQHGQKAEKHDVPDDLDYDGLEIGIASRSEDRYRREICMDEAKDPLDMQIFIRNRNAEKFLNVKLKYIGEDKLWGNEEGRNIPDYVKTEYESGNQSAVDVIFANAAYAVAPAMRGYTVNFNSDKLTYLNTEKLYWNQSYVDAATCYGQLYYIVGDLTLTIYDKALVNFVNLDMAQSMGISADDLYNMVKNGEWTIDNYINILESFTYVDTNNNYSVDLGDVITLSSTYRSESTDGYYASFNVKLMEEKDDGSHVITVDGNTRLQTGIDKMFYIYSMPGVFFPKNVYEPFASFVNGNSFFHTDILYRNASQNAQLRNTSFSYGILPLALLTSDDYLPEEKNLGYHTSSQDAYNSISVLSTHEEKLEATSAFLEVLSSESYNSCRPFYIEKMVKGEYVQDSESVKMIEIIMNGITFETAWLYSFQVDRYAYDIWREPSVGNDTYADRWASIRLSAEEAVRSFDMWFASTQGM